MTTVRYPLNMRLGQRGGGFKDTAPGRRATTRSLSPHIGGVLRGLRRRLRGFSTTTWTSPHFTTWRTLTTDSLYRRFRQLGEAGNGNAWNNKPRTIGDDGNTSRHRSPRLRCFRFAAGGADAKKTGPWGSLTGTVTLDGKPAKTVTVIFENRDKGIALTATTDDAGHYVMRMAEAAGPVRWRLQDQRNAHVSSRRHQGLPTRKK